jgi:hypothetical protein
MAYARGQVLTEDGRIIASFTQDSMIRAFAPNSSSTAMAAESRHKHSGRGYSRARALAASIA